MLSAVERVVVLLDEFDEMVRDRGTAADVLSRFLTTGMLPKLATISKNRRIVFIVATNYINNFDLAISRQGRFDLILQVMPPRFDEKLKKWVHVGEKLDKMGLIDDTHVEEHLGDLTFLEFKTLAAQLEKSTAKQEVRQYIDSAFSRCTLNAKISAEEGAPNWRDASKEQRSRIRLPQER
jgi:SpoVK/Ycf46/Vps4 family AAA+-type ATPase